VTAQRTSTDLGLLCNLIDGILAKRFVGGVFDRDFRIGIGSDLQRGIEELWGPGSAEENRALRELAAAVTELREGIANHGQDSILDTPAIFFDQVWRAERRLQEVRRG